MEYFLAFFFSYIVFLEVEFCLFNLSPQFICDLMTVSYQVKMGSQSGNSFGLDKQQLGYLMDLSGNKKVSTVQEL